VDDDWYDPIVRFLESQAAYVAFVAGSLAVGCVALLVGETWLAALAVVGAFLFAADAISMYGWTRLEAYYDRREERRTPPERTLTPHRMSASTRVIVTLGTLLFVLYLLFGGLLLLISG
jgi:hypothetical protein